MGRVAKLSVKTEVSQTTPLHTRNFWKHSGTFQDKNIRSFQGSRWGKGSSVSSQNVVVVDGVFWSSTMCTRGGRTLEGSSEIVNHFCSSKLCGIVINPGM